MTKKNNTIISDITELVDEDGKKWIQTSADDLFEIKELNSILESIERDKNKSEVVLARIDFQKVDKEYYDTAVTLQKKISKQSALLKKIINESRTAVDRKNKKLKELIEYIKKIHHFISRLESDPSVADKIEIKLAEPDEKKPPVRESVFEEVEELPLDEEAINQIK